jgi:hypothetical protein
VRKLFCFLLAVGFLLTDRIIAKDNESNLIRRAYIDVIGIVPTTQEMEWYTVYNTNGYELAVDWLLRHKNYSLDMPKDYAKEYLLSTEYRALPKSRIEKTQVYKNLLFVTGSSIILTPENVQNAMLKLVQNAILCGDGETEVIDYMTDAMMGRTTNLAEINKLLKVIKDSKKNETDTYLEVLAEILELEDVNSK